MQLAPDDGYTALSPGSVQACPQYITRTDMAREDERKLKKMRYGLDSNRRWIKEEDLFPVQSSVLDEEALFSDVVKEYCIVDPVSCRFFSRGDADIYRVITQGRNYYLKIYRPPKSLESTEAEGSFVWALSNSVVKVVKPVPRRNGQFAIKVIAPEGIRPMLLYEEAPPPLPNELNAALSYQIGGKVAEMHDAADKLEVPIAIPEIDLQEHLKESVFYTSQFLSDDESCFLEEISMQLMKVLQKQPRNIPDFGLCHADLVMSNIRLSEKGGVTFLDFGNASKTWRAYELAIVYWSFINRYKDNGKGLWESFVEGYKSIRQLPEMVMENFTILLVLRQIGFLGGNCATLPLRLGTESFETGFIGREMMHLKQLVENTCGLI